MVSQTPPTPSRRLFYGWIIVTLSFTTTLIAAGIRASPSVLIHPFESAFGWNRAAIASAISLNLFLYGAAAPISGVCLLVMLFLIRWMRNEPSEIGLQPYGANIDASISRAAGVERAPTFSLRQVIRTPTFWFLCGRFFICGGTANGLVGTHLIPTPSTTGTRRLRLPPRLG
jgi:hypothetical protein